VLHVGYISIIRNAGVEKCTALTDLSLQNNRLITDGALKPLTNLSILNLRADEMITDGALSGLPKLRVLNLASNEMIIDECISEIGKDSFQSICVEMITSLTCRDQQAAAGARTNG